MEATTAQHDHPHHALPTEGSALTSVAVDATLHCLTGCAIGEVAGMAIGTAAGFSNGATVVLSIVLAFAFGYGLTSLPLLRAGLPARRVAGVAFASDTLSITTMEIVDNAIVLAVPGALEAGLGNAALLGQPAVLAAGRRGGHGAGQPLAARAGQGPRRGPRDRHPRRAAGRRGEGGRRDRLRVRRRGPGRRSWSAAERRRGPYGSARWGEIYHPRP